MLEESSPDQIEVTIEPPENFAADTKEYSAEGGCNFINNKTVFHWKKISVFKTKIYCCKI